MWKQLPITDEQIKSFESYSKSTESGTGLTGKNISIHYKDEIFEETEKSQIAIEFWTAPPGSWNHQKNHTFIAGVSFSMDKLKHSPTHVEMPLVNHAGIKVGLIHIDWADLGRRKLTTRDQLDLDEFVWIYTF